MLNPRSTAPAAQVDEYRLVRPLGSGTDGGVFLAHDRTLDRAVVLHFLPHDLAAAARLLEGARALARVSHPSLCPVYRIRDSGERPCVVQSFERGERFDALHTPQPTQRVLDIGRALAGAVGALHAAGVAHGEVRGDRIVVPSSGAPRLIGLWGARAAASAEALACDVTALAALLTRVAEPSLRESITRLTNGGPLTAEQLLRALGAIARPSASEEALTTNPYRGLLPFETEDAALFFGRRKEVAEVLGRLSHEPWLLITAPSGAGKSSLVRAGVVPAIVGGALGERRRWDVATVVPGPRPLTALALALAPVFARGSTDLGSQLRRDPGLAGRLAYGRTDAGLLLFVDQLEETMVLADADERAAFFDALSGFSALAPGVRTIATLRADFLDRLSDAGTLGRDLLRATFVLAPMGADGLRDAIVGPARARGFEMETRAMVDSLAAEAETDAGADALPLLSFVLAELWTERDRERRVLPEAALASLGGAAAALARHGETVLASLTTEERREARRILLDLVSQSETRARRSREDLVGEGGANADVALEALIAGRLVVAGEAYEIAHEALVRAWPRLREWLDEASDARSTSGRLAAAAEQWAQLGGGGAAELLWGARQLRDLEIPGALDGATDRMRRFVAASRAAAARTRLRRWVFRLGAPVGALLVVASVAAGVRWGERQQGHAFVAARLAEAEAVLQRLRELDASVATARAEAFARYDAGDATGGESRWRDALALARRESDAFVAAGAPLGLALARDPLDPRARARAADLAYSWLLAAERDREPDVARDLAGRLAQLDDDGSRRAQLAAPARLWVKTAPVGAHVLLRGVHVDADKRRVEDGGRAIDVATPLELAPGSYVLEASAPDRYSTRMPVLLGRGDDARVEIPLPAAMTVPRGFVFVPAGVSQLGTADVEGVRGAFHAEPEHPVHVDAFLIGEREVTYGEYLEFLGSLAGAERDARRPRSTSAEVTYDRDGAAVLRLGTTSARRGDPFCRPKRSVRQCQDWLRFPVAGVSREDAEAYVAWLAIGGVRGARLCSEREWERAARGADGRLFPRGDALHPEDANFDETYAQDGDQWGVDAVGSFLNDWSPFGAFDLAGNVTEWVGSERSLHAARGGDWDDPSLLARGAYRRILNVVRSGNVGMRACANAPTEP